MRLKINKVAAFGSCLCILIALTACGQEKRNHYIPARPDTPVNGRIQPDKKTPKPLNAGPAVPGKLVDFAESLQGIPYKYGSSDPTQGFDCSGFITHVFNHFHLTVPRSSVDFTNAGKEVPLRDALRGDLILFTGTDSAVRVVGHMGIVTSNTGRELSFIHSTSGKAYGVTVTPLNAYYQGRFVKVIRIFGDERARNKE